MELPLQSLIDEPMLPCLVRPLQVEAQCREDDGDLSEVCSWDKRQAVRYPFSL
jgi:hypothetical protein